jgi:mono/diheme cytochrome c family protein
MKGIPARAGMPFCISTTGVIMRLVRLSVAAVLFGLTLGSHAEDAPYTVVDGYKVDAETLKGFRAWRAAACDRCHGANQQGLVGPSLIEGMKRLSKEEFAKTVIEGRLEKGMPAFKTSKMVTENIDQLYAYLKGRSDGAITRAKVEAIK